MVNIVVLPLIYIVKENIVMIDAIQVAGIGKNIYYDVNDKPLKYIPNINKINIFIGENNSGKSRLMRELVSSDMAKVLSNSYSREEITRNYRSQILNLINEIKKYSDYNFNIDSIKEKSNTEYFCKMQEEIDLFKDKNAPLTYPIDGYISRIQGILNGMLEELSRVGNSVQQKSIMKDSPIYIPILRGIENFNIYFDISTNREIINSISMNQNQRNALEIYKANANHIYQNKIQKAYGIKGDLIFTAENLYEDVTDKLLGKEDGRMFIKEFQDFISKQFYNGQEFTLIPQKKEGYLNVKIDKQEKPLHELGDGIKQLITILYKIYENKDSVKVFFIEEPELNLHPGFQRKLIEIFQLDIFRKHQYFITTHSNHFIDSCFDYENISIYKFTNINGSNKEFRIIYTSPNDVSLLQSLGVNNSSVFMANCTIWVEGISDKILIKKYLEKYFEHENINNYKEDINYAFVEYGGNNITHWDFESTDSIETINASGITNRSFIICDNDNDSKGKKTRKRKLKEIFKENYYELPVREIENTISKSVLDRTLLKGKNAKYKKDFKQKDYTKKNVYMGKFIDEHYDLNKKYSSVKGTGTIIRKLEFAREVSQNVIKYEDLSNQAINLCKRISKFIIDSNK